MKAGATQIAKPFGRSSLFRSQQNSAMSLHKRRFAAQLAVVAAMSLLLTGCRIYYTSMFSGEVPVGASHRAEKVWVVGAKLQHSPVAGYLPTLYQLEPSRSTELTLFRQYETLIPLDPDQPPSLTATLEFSAESTEPTLWAIDSRGNIGRLSPTGARLLITEKNPLDFVPDELKLIKVAAERRWLLAVRADPLKSVLFDIRDGSVVGQKEGVLGAGCNDENCWLAVAVAASLRVMTLGLNDDFADAKTDFVIPGSGEFRSVVCGNSTGRRHFVSGDKVTSFANATTDVVTSGLVANDDLSGYTYFYCGPESETGQSWLGLASDPRRLIIVSPEGKSSSISMVDGVLTRFVVSHDSGWIVADGKHVRTGETREYCGGRFCERETEEFFGVQITNVPMD